MPIHPSYTIHYLYITHKKMLLYIRKFAPSREAFELDWWKKERKKLLTRKKVENKHNSLFLFLPLFCPANSYGKKKDFWLKSTCQKSRRKHKTFHHMFFLFFSSRVLWWFFDRREGNRSSGGNKEEKKQEKERKKWISFFLPRKEFFPH